MSKEEETNQEDTNTGESGSGSDSLDCLVVCPVCRQQIKTRSSRKDPSGRWWCKECENKHDAIDWEEHLHGDAHNRGLDGK